MGDKINFSRIFSRLGVASVLYVVALFMGSVALFAVNISITRYHFDIMTILFCSGYVYFLYKKKVNVKEMVAEGLLIGAIIGCSIGLARMFHDFSYDGMAYHQDAVMQLVNGWNPIKNPYSPVTEVEQWVISYSKITWIVGAVFYKAINFFPVIKAPNFILVIGLLFYSMGTLMKYSSKKYIAIIVSVLITLSPIVMGQIYTSYVDGLLGVALGYIMVSIIRLIVEGDEKSRLAYIAIFSGVMVAANLKFTGLGFAFVLCAIYFVYELWERKSIKKVMKLFLYFTIVFTMSVCIFGFNPYITNTIKYKHPLYPLAGEEKVDIMTSNSPKEFEGMNRFEKAFHSYFGITTNSLEEVEFYWENTKEENIFAIDKAKKMMMAPDLRIGGFGLYTPIFILFAVISSICIMCMKKSKYRKVCIVLCIGVFITMLINAEMWWARYIPQLWILMCLNLWILLDSAVSNKNMLKAIIPVIMILCVLRNAYMIGMVLYAENKKVTTEIEKSIDYAKALANGGKLNVSVYEPFNSAPYILKDYGLEVEVVDRLDSGEIHTIPYLHLSYMVGE